MENEVITMKDSCKFCGREIHVEKYLTKREYSCGKCSEFCMKSCDKAKLCGTSWHKEPCISCVHNPYRINHKWNGKEWVRND